MITEQQFLISMTVMVAVFRPCPHVSGFFCIRKDFVADSKVYASTRMRIRCVFERSHVSAKTIRIRQICLQSIRYRMHDEPAMLLVIA